MTKQLTLLAVSAYSALLSSPQNAVSATQLKYASYVYGSNDWCKYKPNSKNMKSKSECSNLSGTCFWDTSMPGGGACQKYVPSYTYNYVYGSDDWCKYKPNTKNMKSKSECASLSGTCSWDSSKPGGGACQKKRYSSSYSYSNSYSSTPRTSYSYSYSTPQTSSYSYSYSTGNTAPATTTTTTTRYYTTINTAQMRTQLSNFEKTMVRSWTNKTPVEEVKAKLEKCRFTTDYEALADELFKEAVLDYLYLEYSKHEGEKEACRCSCCCGCWLAMCAPRVWDAQTQAVYYQRFLTNASENGYTVSNLTNLFSRSAVVKELEKARTSYFGTTMTVNLYAGAAADAVESWLDDMWGWKGVAAIVCFGLFLILLAYCCCCKKSKKEGGEAGNAEQYGSC